MNKWLTDVELSGDTVTLVPMQSHHKEALVEAASDGKLWALWYCSIPSPDTVDERISFALNEKKAGTSLPFVVVENETNKVIGSTRYINAQPTHRRLEIAYTWYSKSFQRTAVNTECKLLLLTYAFEQLNTIAVEFRTHWHNHASRQAISKLGAKQDGVLRNHQIGVDGTYRDTVVFSIIESEWPTVKKALKFKLDSFRAC